MDFFPVSTSDASPTSAPAGSRLEAILRAALCYNLSVAKAITGWRSPYEVFFSRLPALQVVPFFHEGMLRVNHRTKSDVQSVLYYFWNNDHNHFSSTVKVIKASTGGICQISDMVWTVPRSRGGGFSVRRRAGHAGFNINYVPPPPFRPPLSPIRQQQQLQQRPLQHPQPPLPLSQSSSLSSAVTLP